MSNTMINRKRPITDTPLAIVEYISDCPSPAYCAMYNATPEFIEFVLTYVNQLIQS